MWDTKFTNVEYHIYKYRPLDMVHQIWDIKFTKMGHQIYTYGTQNMGHQIH